MIEHWDRVRRSAISLLDELLDEAREAVGVCGNFASPIEHAMAAALYIVSAVRFPEIAYQGIANTEIGTLHHAMKGATSWGLIRPQVEIGAFRADFLVAHWRGLDGVGFIAIECDGHDFHERTRQQVARDKSRDREMAAQGIRIFRFAGSEIWRDPIACADQVLVTAHSVAQDASLARDRMADGDVAGATRALKWAQ